MNRIAQVLAVTLLSAALSGGLGSGASAATIGGVHLSYARTFGLDAGRGDFTLLAEAATPGVSMVSAAVFGLEAQLPAEAGRPAEEVAAGTAFVNLSQLQASTPSFDHDVVFRLSQARLQVAYAPRTDLAPAIHTPRPFYMAGPTIGLDVTNLAGPPQDLAGVSADPGAVGAYVPLRAAASFDAGGSSGTRIPARLGPVHFVQTLGAAQSDATRADAFAALQQCGESQPATTCPYNSLTHMHDVSLSTGTSFGVRAGSHQIRVNLTGGLEHLVHAEDVTVPNLPSVADPSAASAPNLVDVTKANLGASVAVPVTRKVTVGAAYDSQHFQGAYGPAFGSAIDARKNQYFGDITYQVNPKAAITFSARQSQYRDTYTPNFNFTQRQASLNVTVKF